MPARDMSDAELEQRLTFIETRLRALNPAARRWQYGWTGFYATVAPGDGLYRRVLGSVGSGQSGVPVAGGHDIDGDGHADSAFAAMRSTCALTSLT